MRLFDLHCDTLGTATRLHALFSRTGGAVDGERGAVFGEWIQAFAVWLPDRMIGASAREEYRALTATARRWEAEEPEMIRFVREDGDVGDVTASGVTCRAFLTVENGGALGEDPGWIDRFADDGVKVASLTWNGANYWGAGCLAAADTGLTDAGRAALRRMETRGILPDVSHLSEKGFWELADTVTCPILATHSDSAAVFPHLRNLTDDQFAAIRQRGGLVGLNLFPGHLGEGTAECFARHLTHFLELGGEDILCIGSDFDGFDLPAGVGGAETVCRLYEQLTDLGFSGTVLDKVFYGNAVRFFQQFRKFRK